VLDGFSAHASAPLAKLRRFAVAAAPFLGRIQIGLLAWAVAQWPQEGNSELALALVDAALAGGRMDDGAEDASSMNAQTIAHLDYLLRSLGAGATLEVAARRLRTAAKATVLSLNEHASRYDQAALAACAAALARDAGAAALVQGPVLLVGDKTSGEGFAGALAAAAEAAGRAAPPTEHWSRFSSASGDGEPWPSQKALCRAVVLRLPPTGDHGAVEMALAAAASTMEVGGTLWVCGARAEGVTSAAVKAALRAAGFGDVTQSEATRNLAGGVVAATKVAGGGGGGGGLGAFARTVSLLLPDGYAGSSDEWRVYPGLFAGGRLDVMTAFMLQHLPLPLASSADVAPLRLLDFACGSGVIARAVASLPNVVEAVDADAVAVAAARRNLAGHATVFLSDSFAALGGKTYHHVLSNPPLHNGKALDLAVLLALVRGAPAHLEPGGSLWIVTQNGIPAGPLLADVFGNGAVSLVSDGRFALWRAVKASGLSASEGEDGSASNPMKNKLNKKRKSEGSLAADGGTPAEIRKKMKKETKTKKKKRERV
jgi:16S rRNA G1207 methylase RsmC